MDPRFHDLPPLCSISLLRQLKELGKSNYSPDYWLVIKGSNSGTGGWQRCKGKGKVLPRISKWLLLWISMSSPTQKRSEPCLCGLLWKFHYIHVLSWFVCPLCVCVCVSIHSVAQSYLTLGDPMDCSLPGSSVHGIGPTRIPEWVATSSSRASSRPKLLMIYTNLFKVWKK